MSKQTPGLPEGIELGDPRPIAAENPYTFFLPDPADVERVEPGDLIKAIFREKAGGRKYDGERMWVLVDRIDDGILHGILDNEPHDMPLIARGDKVSVPITHVISVQFDDPAKAPPSAQPDDYFERCFVDACVVEGRSRAVYLYRENSDMTREGDPAPDSGWRIRGTQAAIDEDAKLGAEPMYIALAKVLNADDRWLHLIEAPIGSTFQWDDDLQSYSDAK